MTADEVVTSLELFSRDESANGPRFTKYRADATSASSFLKSIATDPKNASVVQKICLYYAYMVGPKFQRGAHALTGLDLEDLLDQEDTHVFEEAYVDLTTTFK